MKTVLALAGIVAVLAAAPQAEAQDAGAVKKCQACHTFDNGGPKKMGPNLFGVYGRAATIPALAGKGVVWDDANLMEYLANPSVFVASRTGGEAKSKMILLLKDETERKAAVEYLKTLK